MFKPKNILVTGGSGFIGANYIKYMLGKYNGINISNLDKLTYASEQKNLASIAHSDNYQFYEGDICDRELVSKIITNSFIDTIVHFAAESHVDRSIKNSNDFINTNIIGTHCLLEESSKIWRSRNLNENSCRFHHISTDEVYGSLDKDDHPFTEENKYYPNSPYSASKASSDHLVRAWSETHKLPISISNCSNNYGRFQHNEKFIPVIVNSCKSNKTIPVYGNGKNIRDWLHVDDHCMAIDKIIRKGDVGATYNIGGDNEIANIDLVEMICSICDGLIPEKFNYKELIVFTDDRLGHDFRYSINSQKMHNDLGWSPKVNFKDGLTDTIDWYLNSNN